MTQTPAPPGNPFTPGNEAPPERFVGRENELREILARLDGMLSVSLVGETRIGKSSLLAYLATRLPVLLAGPQRYVPVLLNMAEQRTKADFCRAVLAGLLPHLPPAAAPEAELRALEQLPAPGEAELRRVVELARDAGLRPVLLLDEFKHAADNSKEFDAVFLGWLRSLYTGGKVALVIATRQPLADIPHFRSYAANGITKRVTLRKLLHDEAEALIRQPSDQPFDEAEVALCLSVGKLHPLRLQCAGFELYEAKRHTDSRYYNAPGQLSAQAHASLQHAVAEEFQHAMDLSQTRDPKPSWFGRSLDAIGLAAIRTGEGADQAQARVMGGFIVIAVVVGLVVLALWVMGVITQEQLGEFLRKLTGGS